MGAQASQVRSAIGMANRGSTQTILSVASPAATSLSSISPFVTLGAGCYWGTEKFIKKDFQKTFPNSIKSAKVGFMSPDPNAVKNPSYRSVCSGATGHVEVLHVELNEPEKHYEELLRFFYMFHDPTTRNRQGNDMGSQYASYIFTNDDTQIGLANKVTRELNQHISLATITSYEGDQVKTLVSSANEFYEATEDHQNYLKKNPGGYCNHYMRFKSWPADVTAPVK